VREEKRSPAFSAKFRNVKQDILLYMAGLFQPFLVFRSTKGQKRVFARQDGGKQKTSAGFPAQAIWGRAVVCFYCVCSVS
jgi:hypothetical protein